MPILRVPLAGCDETINRDDWGDGVKRLKLFFTLRDVARLVLRFKFSFFFWAIEYVIRGNDKFLVWNICVKCTFAEPNGRLEGVTNLKSHSRLWSMLIWRISLITFGLYGALDPQNQKIGIIGVPEKNSLDFATKAQVI